MQVHVHAAPLKDLPVDALIVGIPQGTTEPTGVLAELDGLLGGMLKMVIASPTFQGKDGQVEVLYPVVGLTAQRIVLVGLGEEALTAESWRKLVSAGVEPLKDKAARLGLLLPAGLDNVVATEAGVESVLLSAYTFHPYRTKPDEDALPFQALVVYNGNAAAAERGVGMARQVNWVRDHSNMPGNMLPVSGLIKATLERAAGAKLKATVVDYAALKSGGFGCLVAVGQGSIHKPAMVVLEYNGGPAGEAPIALIGKGVTFDTGGICIKPRAGMEEMKTDMHGVASVVGAMVVAAERGLPLNIVGVLPMAENMPDGEAFKPGDIVTAYNGLTVEIIDTDAEGRLILADGLAYAAKNFKPRYMLDIATLTGSVIMALGYEATGIFTNNDAVAKSLSEAGDASGERVWRLPLWPVHEGHVRSDIADLKHVSREKGDATTAAAFLKQFTNDIPWAHLDIAGSSFFEGPKDYRPKGSTGVGVRLLFQWLETLSKTKA